MREKRQDQSYREQNKKTTRDKLRLDPSYKLANYNRAKDRLKRLATDDSYKQYKKTQIYMSRHMQTSVGGKQSVQRTQVTSKVLTVQDPD